MAKKEALKSNLIKKKPIINEEAAQKVVKKVHATKDTAEEETVKTSVDFRKSLYKAMKMKLLEEGYQFQLL